MSSLLFGQGKLHEESRSDYCVVALCYTPSIRPWVFSEAPLKNCPQCSATYPDEYAVCPKDGSRLASGSPWEANSVIRGKYRILGKIGQGGMATVYRAHHELLDEPRALKVINPELARDEAFVKRFKNEAINTRKLQHPNAVRVDDLDIAEDSRPFIAMELVGGESLKDLIERTGPMPCGTVVEIASQVCEALGAAHELGVTHRDIKPDNIVLLRGRDLKLVVKILDFGIASLKEVAGGGSNTLTGTGVVIGTPDYMSPEQAMGKRGDEIDGRSDIYSLGIVIYRMLTGELPFKADTTVGMILHHVQDVPQPPQKLKPELGIPDSISDIVMKALEKDREKRFATAPDMGTALRLAWASASRPVPHGGMLAAALATVKTEPAPVASPQTRVERPKPPSSAPRPVAPSPPPAMVPKTPVPAARPRQPGSPPRPTSRQAGSPMPRVKPQKKFPLYQTLAGVVVVALVALGARHLMQRQSPAPPINPPASAPQTSPPRKSAQASRSGGKKTAVPTAESPQGKATLSPESQPSSDQGSASTPSVKPGEVPAPTPTSGTQGDTTTSATTTEPGSQNNPSAGTLATGKQDQKSQSPTGAQPHPKEPPKRAMTEGERAAEIIRQDMRSEVRPMNDRATQLFNNGMYMRAAQIYRRVLEIEPENERALKGLKKCEQKIREMGERNSDEP